MSWSCGLQFRVRSGPDRGVTYPIDSPVIKIGRIRQPGERQTGWIRVSDDTVSRLHCELFWQEDRKNFRLLHRSTTNCTYVNGEVVEDTELFDGDLLEIGAITLELQEADLRWSRADDKAVTDWPVRAHEGPPAVPVAPRAAEPQKIPGATVPVTSTTGVKIGIGPKVPFVFLTREGESYPLRERKIRFGCEVDPENDPNSEDPKAKPHFDVHYVLQQLDFSFYNLILRYDELYQGYKAARLGPKAQEISIQRSQGGLRWSSTFPEAVEVELHPGDLLLMGNVELRYEKAKADG